MEEKNKNGILVYMECWVFGFDNNITGNMLRIQKFEFSNLSKWWHAILAILFMIATLPQRFLILTQITMW